MSEPDLDLDLASLGIPAETTSTLSVEHAALLAATLDTPLDVTIDQGHPLPLLWHWAFFNPVVATAGLGLDGHPLRHSPLIVGFPRRMWVGGEVRLEQPLRLGTPAVKRTRLVDHTVKHGSTGDLLVVTLEHVVEQDDAIALTERHDVIYRQAGGATPAPGPPVDATDDDGHESVLPTSALLFRFSAVTFNSHRIHYDHAYATEVEHYPGLVVHGPLTAMLLADLAARRLDRPVRRFVYRASHPLFVEQPIRLACALDDSGSTATLRAVRVDGATAMTATAVGDG